MPSRGSTTLLALIIGFVGLAGPFLLLGPARDHARFFPTSATMGYAGATAEDRAVRATTTGSEYLLGTGIGDMMGYANVSQVGSGLHMRQRARAFLVAESADPSQRVLFINIDCGMGDSAITRGVLARLEELYPGVYSASNVALAGTHTHSGVGGFLENLLPQITSLGFVPQTYEAIVAGSIIAVQRAHANLAPGSLSIGNSTLLNSNLNRSPTAYLVNPAEERAQYEHDVEKEFTLVKFDDAATGTSKGFLSFFSVHGTSIFQNQSLISGDNKGMAAYLSESYYDPTSVPGSASSSFVAGYAQSVVGDTTPNTLGAYCESPGEAYDGQPCEPLHSTCGGQVAQCHGRGPGFRVSDFESNRIIGTNQHDAAVALMSSSLTAISGPIKSTHQYTTMANYTFPLANGTDATLCTAALGYGFAGGTTDGAGGFPFIQGANTSQSQNPFWEAVQLGTSPQATEEQRKCQAPKPILLNTGAYHVPYDWAPAIVAHQMFRIGQLIIIMSPSEPTTMAGRRIRATVRKALLEQGTIDDSAHIVIGTIANGAYSHYTATREEYSVQRYEGASTLFGPATLEAYQFIFETLSPYLATNSATSPPPGTPPPDLTGKALSLQPPVLYDNPAFNTTFGSVLTDVFTDKPYSPGATVSAVFVGANPRNDLRLEGTFLEVQRETAEEWVTVKTDSHPTTTLHWVQTNLAVGSSCSNISWVIESETPAGSYRILYFGDSKVIPQAAKAAQASS